MSERACPLGHVCSPLNPPGPETNGSGDGGGGGGACAREIWDSCCCGGGSVCVGVCVCESVSE